MAEVNWEDIDRPKKEIYFETDEIFGNDLQCNPHAFLVACTMPAMHHGEKRIFIDSEICPELKNGVTEAMRQVRYWYEWYNPKNTAVRIEAKAMSNGRRKAKMNRAAFLFSGGIDSLATLRINRVDLPSEHPRSFKDGIFIIGLQPEVDHLLEDVQRSLSVIAKDAEITLIPITTNIRSLYDDWEFWCSEFASSVFAATAYAINCRVTSLTIPSSVDLPQLVPHGSHPLLDPKYSTNNLLIHHDKNISRLAKTKLLADWHTGLQQIRVCNAPKLPGSLNCCKCEKCVRTMLALLALGKLNQTRAFDANDVSEEMIQSGVRLNDMNYCFYPELLPPLHSIGRYDLVQAISSKMV